MERRNPHAQEWRFVIEVRKSTKEPLCIRLRETEHNAIRFGSWEALYRYLSDRFPEWSGYLR